MLRTRSRSIRSGNCRAKKLSVKFYRSRKFRVCAAPDGKIDNGDFAIDSRARTTFRSALVERDATQGRIDSQSRCAPSARHYFRQTVRYHRARGVRATIGESFET